MFTKFRGPQVNTPLTENKGTLINSKGWRVGRENPKYVLLIEFILLISWHVKLFFPAAESSLWFAFILSNTISKALQQLNRPIHLNKLFPGRVWGFFLFFFSFLNLLETLSHPYAVRRHKRLPDINLACLCLNKDKWEEHCWISYIFSITATRLNCSLLSVLS